MQDMQPWEGWCPEGARPWPLAARAGLAGAAFGLAVAAAGCTSSISTPLPDLKPSAASSVSQEDRKKAIDELNHKRDTHEEEAERQIEESR